MTGQRLVNALTGGRLLTTPADPCRARRTRLAGCIGALTRRLSPTASVAGLLPPPLSH